MRGRKMKKRTRREKGFTLVEILVALTILGLALAAISITFQSQSKSFSIQEQVSSMQIGGALALSRIAQEVRMAGYGVPAGTSPITGISDGAGGGPDSFTIVANLQASTFLSSDAAANANSVPVEDVTQFSNVSAGTELTILDPLRNLIETNSFASYDAGTSRITLQNNLSAQVPEGSYIGVSPENITYSIDSSDPNHPFLSRNGDVMAADIEDLQVAYGEDDNLDGLVDAWRNVPNNPGNILAVRISIVARSRYPEQGASYSLNGVENGRNFGPDGYRRRVYTTTVKLRNLLL
ncbi:MAG: prepilin-type N-terminal cleavage/methylation domain-containing protein [Deltaproteobacteria bacterium]|nr:MAG: prepilin-type N-terminal cleavage/methylation domain-containing protein [Deltaproteobacteria bacterium]